MEFCPCFGRRGGQKPEDHETSALATVQSAIAPGSLDPLFVEPNKQYRVKNGNPEPGTSGGDATIQYPVQMFSYHELVVATDNFREDLFLGQGGFGSVHKGWLDDGQIVAIKQLDRTSLQGNTEFLVEVIMLSLFHHEHLVKLIGSCTHKDNRMLVYEYMPLGSLEDHLHDIRPDRAPLDWKTRMKIVAGAAKGLEYLHDKVNPPIIYRDFKPSNILLGEGYFPKLSDFGLAKLGPAGDKSHVTTRVMGTQGYCAPEYAATGKLTVKSDIYSFGVVILEIITGRRGYDPNMPSLEQYVVDWARPMFKDYKNFPKMADRTLKGKFPRRDLVKALAVAALCVHENPAKRPRICEVAEVLSYLESQAEASNDNYKDPPAPESTQKQSIKDDYIEGDVGFRKPHQSL